jgi:RecA-family ATPase
MSRVSEIKGEDSSPFKIYDLDTLETLKDPEPLIRGVLTRGCVALLFGEYGTAKSFVALDWAAHLAKGIDWFGYEITGEHRILYVAAEGAAGLKKRVKAWEMEYGEIPSDNFHLTRVAVRFGNDQEHYDYLHEMIIKNEYDFIVIDTLSRNTPGMDENGPDMSEFVERIFTLRDAHSTEKTAFLIVHHAGKDRSKGARGWTGIPGATDFSYRMSKGSDLLNVFTLSTDRTKDAEPLDEMAFTLKIHVTDKEWGHTSCTLEDESATSRQQPSTYAESLQAKVDKASEPPWSTNDIEEALENLELEKGKSKRPRGKRL